MQSPGRCDGRCLHDQRSEHHRKDNRGYLTSAYLLDERVVNALLRRVVGRRVLRMPLHSNDAMLFVLDRFE